MKHYRLVKVGDHYVALSRGNAKGARVLEQAMEFAGLSPWEIFELITSIWHGKQYYFMQPTGVVYSRESGEYLTQEQALNEFTRRIDFQ